ncbi:MAG: MFS transporter [Saprospiraceae bacterium]
MNAQRSFYLIVIVVAQFAGVSLWFAGNGVLHDLITDFNLPASTLGHLTSAVQLGFIAGTFFYSLFAFADRHSPTLVFLISAMLAALCSLSLIVSNGDSLIIYGSRFLTGFFLAGIYPVGMKIAADHFDKDLGKALGYLLGALVLGTALPHLLRNQLDAYPWQNVIKITSAIAILGAVILFFTVPNGPFRRKQTGKRKWIVAHLFQDKEFSKAAFGYFGHMWELYAFWAFVPFMIPLFISVHNPADISLLSFFIIAAGALGCIAGGYVSLRKGNRKVAMYALAASGMCCLMSPLFFTLHPWIVFGFMLFWGVVVITDSPQFSTLIANTAPIENRASALTMVNCIGFGITIISIQLLNFLSTAIPPQWLLFLLFPGPVLGLYMMVRQRNGPP